MKRFNQVFLIISFLVLFSGCSKENYDKWLTSGTWKLNSFSQETKTVTTTTWSITVANNSTVTRDVLDVLASGVETVTTTNTNAPASGTTTSTTEIDISNNTSTVVFSKGGTYTWTITTKAVSTQDNTNTTTGPVVNSATPPVTNTSSDDWAWLEDGSIKDQIFLNNYRNPVMIKLTKNSMTWNYNPSSNSTQTVPQGGEEVTTVTTVTTTDTWSFGQ